MNKSKNIRISIITISIIGLLSLLSWTLTTLAWGTTEDSTIYFLLIYPTFILSTILIIAKIRFGFFLTLIVAIGYAILLTNEVGRYLIFKRDNFALFGVLFIPYLIVLILIPLTINYLTLNFKNKRTILRLSIILSVSFLFYEFFDRYNKDYYDRIFIYMTLLNDNEAELVCRPSFADAREFIIKTDSKKFIDVAKRQGELKQGIYLVRRVRITKRFNFDKLVSITITDINAENIKDDLTWEKGKLNGDISFLDE